MIRASVFEELGETSRRQILAELRTGPKNVTSLVETTGLKQPNVSNHLARMRNRGIVAHRKIGREVEYSLASPEVEAIIASVLATRPADPIDVDWNELAQRYAESAVAGDDVACGEVLDIAFRSNRDIIDIYVELIAKAMGLVGNWYKIRVIDEAQEHLASSITERMMSRTMQITGPTRRHGTVALLGCAPNNFHVIGLRMISDYMRLAGWKTLFLGADVPPKSFLNSVSIHRPKLVLLSCMTSEGIQQTIDLVKDLKGARSSAFPFTIGVGGGAAFDYTEDLKAAGADFTSNNLRTFASEILPALEQPTKR